MADFKAAFTKPASAKVKEPVPSESAASESMEGETDGRTPEELGSALKEAMDTGDGMSICEAVKAIMSEYKG